MSFELRYRIAPVRGHLARLRSFLLVCGIILALVSPAAHAQRLAPAYESNFKVVRALLEQPESQMDLASIKLTIDQMIDPATDKAALLQQLDDMAAKIKASFNTPLGSSPLSYLESQSQLRNQLVTIIPRTRKQDQAALDNLSRNGCRNCVGVLDNCAARTDSALRASGVSTNMSPFPGGVARDAMRAPGATDYYIPKGGPIPPGLVDALRQFNPPNVP